jgi:hypothetical protein
MASVLLFYFKPFVERKLFYRKERAFAGQRLSRCRTAMITEGPEKGCRGDVQNEFLKRP